MADPWICVAAKSADSGWTGALPLAQWAAWFKCMCWMKQHGCRGGILANVNLPHMLRSCRISKSVWERLCEAAEANGALERGESVMTVTKWHLYQYDSTNADRQARHRGKNEGVTDEPVTEKEVTVRNGSNGRQDKTRQDKTGQGGGGREAGRKPPLTGQDKTGAPCAISGGSAKSRVGVAGSAARPPPPEAIAELAAFRESLEG